MERRLASGEKLHLAEIERPFKSELGMSYVDFRNYMIKHGQGFCLLFKAWIKSHDLVPMELKRFVEE
jgi:hypothetical protein